MSLSIGHISELPRVDLGHKPTPIDELKNLAAELNGPRLFVKRDDCTGLAFGGNKVRHLEFYLGEALAESADTILITGAVQSNFVRLTAAAACKLGLACHIQLEERVQHADSAYRVSGNVLLDRLLGAVLHSYDEGEDEAGADRRIREIAAELQQAGRRPYVIPLAPGHPPLSALGYVVAAQEILTQMSNDALHVDEMVVASGSGHTHAGLLFGLRALGSSIRVTGICVRRQKEAQIPRIREHCQAIAHLVGIDPVVAESDIHLVDGFLAPGYGHLNEAAVEAIRMAAQFEGLMLDPVYTAKAMAGFLQRARRAGRDKSLLFVHTGGTPALFAYEPVLTDSFSSQ